MLSFLLFNFNEDKGKEVIPFIFLLAWGYFNNSRRNECSCIYLVFATIFVFVFIYFLKEFLI